MKKRAFLSAMLAALGILTPAVCQVRAIEFDGLDIFDNGAAEEAEGVQIVNGRIVLTGGTAKKPEKPAQPDPAGDQVLELTDGSQLHGKLTAFGKSELLWQRADTAEPLTFSPQDIKRIVLGGGELVPAQKANATVKLTGGDWLTGDLSALQNGKFRLAIEGAGIIEIEREKVEWLHLSKTPPPDAYEGPSGPMGLAGWDTGGPAGAGAWDYADGALVARAAMPLTRRFEVLSDRMDIEFSASDGGNAIRGLTLWLQPGLQSRGYSKGSVYLRFQANNISANSYDGSNMKNFSANVPEEKNPPKETRYRILQDRRGGKVIIFVNGKKVADWDTQGVQDSAQGGSLSWQPTYWSSNMAWTLSKVRVRPWDGSTEPDSKPGEAGKDLLSNLNSAVPKADYTGWPVVNGAPNDHKPAPPVETRRAGSLEAISPDSVKFSGREIPRIDPIFIRLNRNAVADPPTGAVARVWLAQRGEFDVTALGFRDGQIRMRTSFGGDIALPLTAVRAIEFPHRLAATDRALAEGGDTLIFRNGDELHGTLLSASHDQKVQWKPVKGEKPVEFATERLAGILLANRAKPAARAPTAAVRFRNGDWLPGELLLLDKQQLRLKSPIAENLQLDRAGIRAIYFGQNSEVPVWDGASDRQSWMKATNAEMYGGRRGMKDDTVKRNPWRYLDGAFNLPRNTSRNGYGNGPNIGRTFDTLPDKVELSFELSTPRGPAGYSIQLFNDENRPGLMIQGGWDSAYIYDMSPRKQGGVFFNQPQQIDFGESVGSEGNRRHFRFLADRRTGRLVMIVNGTPVGQFGQKPGKESAKPGKGIAIVPQPMNSSVTVSNIWLGPWSGDAPDVPKNSGRANRRGMGNLIFNGGGVLNLNGANQAVGGKAPDGKASEEKKDKPAAKPAAPAADLLALVNGDETSGIIERASTGELHLKCDVGDLDIPVSRVLVAEFSGTPQPPAAGIRLHLAGKGSITVDSLQVADGKVTCHSASAGDLAFSAGALSEIVFQPRNLTPPENAADKKSGNSGGNQNGGNFINGGGGQFQIQGNIIINGALDLNGGVQQFIFE
jgi:hypothetical protein